MSQQRRLPAEWEPQDAILLAWPHEDSDWAPLLDQVVPVYLELVRQISRFEQVLIATPNPISLRKQLQTTGLSLERIRLFELPGNDTWTRDCGPLTVLDQGMPRLLDFGFNGWGLKFACHHDNQLSRRLHSAGGFGATRLETQGLILEGGSIESDGRGTLLTTSACLLEANRNPHLTKEQIEARLLQRLGGKQLLWLDHGHLEGDDTDAHIDTLARLAPEDTIVYVRCDDPGDSHYPDLQQMEAQLRSFRTIAGKPFRLVPLPWPAPCHDREGHRLPATYANFLVINGAVLVPTYGDPHDAEAVRTIAGAFPGREAIAVNCRPLIEQHGSLHCITMQLPQGVLP